MHCRIRFGLCVLLTVSAACGESPTGPKVDPGLLSEPPIVLTPAGSPFAWDPVPVLPGTMHGVADSAHVLTKP